MKQLTCDTCDATYPVKFSVIAAKVRAVMDDWAVGGLFHNHDYCPKHTPRTLAARAAEIAKLDGNSTFDRLVSALERLDEAEPESHAFNWTDEERHQVATATQTVIFCVRNVIREVRP